MSDFVTLGGRVRCTQCTAKSKRTQQQCKSPAMRGKTVCRMHGGKSTGPRTKEGRKRCAKARTIHGRETRQARAERQAMLSYLYDLEMEGRKLGLIVGPKAPGRKPVNEN